MIEIAPGVALYAWVTVMPDGVYSLVGYIDKGLHMPLLATSESLMRTVGRDIALAHSERSGQPVMLVRFNGDGEPLERIPQ